MKKLEVKREYNVTGGKYLVDILVVEFQEDNNYIHYSPHLEVYGYGLTEEEAKQSFDHSLEEFLSYTHNKRTLVKELERMGWVLKKGTPKQPKKISPPSLPELIRTNKTVEDLFSKKELKTSHNQVALQA